MEEPTIIDKLEREPEDGQHIRQKEKTKKRRKGFWLIILLLVVIFPLGVVGYLLATGQLQINISLDGNDKEVVEEEEGEKAETSDIEWKNWEGEYLKARLPEGWKLVENKLVGDYAEDREQNFIDAGYDGIMGFYILDGQENVVAQLSYMEGPFCDSACPTSCIALEFDITKDSDKQAYEEGLSNFEGVEGCCSEAEYVYVKDYVEIEFLGNDLRRILDIGSDYRRGYIGDNNLESIDCFKEGIGVEIEDFGFGSYVLDVSDTFPIEDIYLLDGILESLAVKDDSLEQSGLVWEGDYIAANLPADWTMETRSVVEGYSGYPGFVLKHNDQVIFDVYQVGAIGFTCAYSELVLFPDSKQIEGDTVEVGNEDLCGIHEIPITRIDKYKSINLLVNELRRVNDNIYQDHTFRESEYFLTQDPSIPILVFLKDSNGNSLGSPEYGLVDDSLFMVEYDLGGLSESQRLEFDQILESMKIVNKSM